MKLKEIAAALSAEVVGNGDLEVTRLVHPGDAGAPGDLAVALSKDARAALADSTVEAAIVTGPAPGLKNPPEALIVAENERMAFAELTALFDPGPAFAPGVHPTAIVADDATIGESVNVGAFTVVGAGSSVGAGTTVLSHVTIGAGVTIGKDSLIHPGVRIGDRVRIGARAVIHNNAAIGSDGFSFIPARLPDGSVGAGRFPKKTRSLGTVVIEDDVEIGAGTTIDRATLKATTIGRGTKIDNLVQIGHNVTIGEACIICGMVGIAGSTTIGDRVILAGGAGVSDHVTIGSDAVITGKAGVGSHVPAGAKVSGVPALRHERWVEFISFLGRHKSLLAKVETVRKRLDALGKDEKSG